MRTDGVQKQTIVKTAWDNLETVGFTDLLQLLNSKFCIERISIKTELMHVL